MDDSGFCALIADLLERSHRVAAEELVGLVAEAARAMGLTGADIYLADVQQEHLVPLAGHGPALSVERTLAGLAYRSQNAQIGNEPGTSLWLPLSDGIERIGVLHLEATGPVGQDLGQCRTLAGLVALLIVSKGSYSDTLQQLVRSRPMRRQAELAWAFMPPRTIGTRAVTSSAVLEPAYEIGGDAFDHALGETLHLTVVDAMGHDTASGLCAALAVAGCRAARRRGLGTSEIAAEVDQALSRWVPDRLLTAVFAELDFRTGHFSWVNCGHPAPLLIRHQNVVAGALTRRANLPLGLGPGYPAPDPALHQVQLEPGDRILVYTDGVTESRSEDGELFGEARLVDTVIRATAAGQHASEALRRLIHAILGHRNGRLTDDATILLAEWHPAPDQL